MAVSCSVFKVLISTGRRLTPPVPMGKPMSAPAPIRSGTGLAPVAACGRRPGGLFPLVVPLFIISSPAAVVRAVTSIVVDTVNAQVISVPVGH